MQQPLRICVEKMSKEDTEHLKHLQSMSKSGKNFSKLSAAFYTSKLWPNNSTITVGFLEEPSKISRTSIAVLKSERDASGNSLKIDPLQYEIDKLDIKTAIKKIVNERINPIVNLKYTFIDDAKNAQIRVGFDPDQGAWSLLGIDCLTQNKGESTMNLGWFDVGTTIHEFCHSAGMVHEHQNPNGEVIQWNKPAVYAWAKSTQGWDKETTYTNIIQRYSVDQINGSGFDPRSIMLYFFPASLTLNNKGTNENIIFSPTDVEYLNSVYPGSPKNTSQFYKDAYNEQIPTIVPFERNKFNKRYGTGDNSSGNSSNVWIIVVCIIVVIAILIGVFVYERNIKKNM